MSGHSKWANIKRRKGAVDAERAKAFTKISREIIVAVQQGGPDPDGNFRLKLMIQKAKAANMPNDNINRCIQKAAGNGDDTKYNEVVYEGYGPAGTAILLEIMTDNRNRTASEIRYLFSRNGGNLGETGCVAWMFERRGVLVVERGEVDEDEVMLLALEAGAVDVITDGDVIEIHTDPSDFMTVKADLEAQGLQFLGAEISFIPQNTMTISEDKVESMEKLIEILEELDEVQDVYSNYEVES